MQMQTHEVSECEREKLSVSQREDRTEGVGDKTLRNIYLLS